MSSAAQARTATPSLRRRVTAAVLGVVAVLLVLVVVLVDVLLGARLESDLDSRLRDRVVQAQQLIAAGATPEELVTGLSGQQIRIKVSTADGEVMGDPGLNAPGTPPPAGRTAAPVVTAPTTRAGRRPPRSRPDGHPSRRTPAAAP